MQAVDRYDWRRGTKFSTYAAWWIRHGVVQAFATGANTIRVPDSVRERLVDVQRAERDLTAILGRRPSVQEIAGELELTVEQVLELRFGVRDGVARTADAVDAELGVARERVRQIELHTLRKLGSNVVPQAQAA